jgi:Tfp pilus assembly pilus retraction ATPase PilT
MTKKKVKEFYKKNLSHMTLKQIGKVSDFLASTEFKNNTDYRINYFENRAELTITSKKLEKLVRTFLKI